MKKKRISKKEARQIVEESFFDDYNIELTDKEMKLVK